MNQRRVLGVLRLHPARSAFDVLVRRTLVPDLRDRAGFCGAWVGRRGPDDLGERAIVTCWEDEPALRDTLGADPVAAWLAPAGAETTDAHLEVLPLRVDVRSATAPPAAILRIARGRLAQIDLATYAQHVDKGARRDQARGRGPDTLLMGVSGPASFVTVSTWADWEAIAAATGASLGRPVRTREQHVLEGFTAVHYELVPH